jgi:hypothetical protein
VDSIILEKGTAVVREEHHTWDATGCHICYGPASDPATGVVQ